ncbi:hypothetical protein ZOSMA_313G00100 [Zostera marina]|uniref:Metal-dependent protein hydrolase n=1 Tax=Zostera marina TaxID=29655 RepID=A0A0K9PBV0_ZOSMR|nr:hypothetical protein ZOSMA_313G00100 [Zostera marina]
MGLAGPTAKYNKYKTLEGSNLNRMLLGGGRRFWLQRNLFPTFPHATTFGTCFHFKVCSMSFSAEGVDLTSPDNTNPKRVGTHNGSFHCDEALGCFMIRLTSKFKDSQIVRSRDPKVLDTLDAVLDVGGVYNPDTDRYDHYQKGFSQVLGHGFDTKLSSAGLVYKHYGMEIVAKELQLEQCHENAVDAIDNGINEYDTELSPKYVNNTNLSSRVSRLNLGWNDPDQSSHKEDQAFQNAMELTGREFLESLRFYVRSWLPARTIVMESLLSRYDADATCQWRNYDLQELLSREWNIFLKIKISWKLHLFELEAELKIDPLIKYVIYQDDRSKSYRIQAVSVAPGNFESQKALPLAWRGMTDDELSKESDIFLVVFLYTSVVSLVVTLSWRGPLLWLEHLCKCDRFGEYLNHLLVFFARSTLIIRCFKY